MNIVNKIKEKLLHYTWDLAYGIYDDSIIEKGLTKDDVRIVNNPYKTKWFADPFIYDDNELFLQLFVEEYDKNIKRGRIARLKIDKVLNSIIECSIILDLPTHLSFPAIYRENGKVYVHPENSESGKSFLYEYDNNKDRLINPILVIDKPLTDSVICKNTTSYDLFATIGEDANKDKLTVFESHNINGPYSVKETIAFPNYSARMAGHFFCRGEDFIRPAQNCNGDYGKAVWFYNSQTVIGKLLPWGIYDGIHTFNTIGGTFVIDLKKYDYVLLYRIKTMIKKCCLNNKR